MTTGQGGVRPRWWIAAALAAVLALVAALIYSGAAAATQLSDPGALTRWGLPVAKAAQNVSMAVVVGALMFAVGILPHKLTPRLHRTRNKEAQAPVPEHPAFTRVLVLAQVAAVVWTLSAVVVLVLTFSDIAGLPLSTDSAYTASLVGYLTGIANGQAWLSISIIAAVVATLTFGLRSTSGLAATLVLALLGVVPLALIGHAAAGDDHDGAVNSIGLHLVGVCLWVGGLAALAVVSRLVAASGITEAVLKRFSAVAGIAFGLVFFSGVINAALRMTTLSQLNTPWGTLVLLKAAATLVLGAIGFMHRRWIIPQLAEGSGHRKSAARVLWQLLAVELVIMGAVSGIAVALGRTAPPRPEQLATDASPARILTGYDLPPELTGAQWFTEWRWDWLWVAICVIGAAAYLTAMVRLRRRGDRWPVWRAASWLAGLAVLTYLTSGPPAVYGMVLFSAHMVSHMGLTMVSPLFLVLGTPVTLALKALSPRQDGSRGPREWMLALLHSKFAAVVTHPVFAAVNFAGSILVFYYTPLFGFALQEHAGHELMNVHFTLTGYIFVLSMIGGDPLPRRLGYPFRLITLFATMVFHAFMGVAMTSSTSLLEASWFGNIGRNWGPSAIADQQIGGAVMWGVGEIPTLCVAVGVALVWSRSDERETKRNDRAADRNNDAELTAYNDMFAKLAQRDARIEQPTDVRKQGENS